MEPSRYDIPALDEGVEGIEEQQIANSIEMYQAELSEALRSSNRVKMIRAGQVLVSLLGRQNKIVASSQRRAFVQFD